MHQFGGKALLLIAGIVVGITALLVVVWYQYTASQMVDVPVPMGPMLFEDWTKKPSSVSSTTPAPCQRMASISACRKSWAPARRRSISMEAGGSAS